MYKTQFNQHQMKVVSLSILSCLMLSACAVDQSPSQVNSQVVPKQQTIDALHASPLVVQPVEKQEFVTSPSYQPSPLADTALVKRHLSGAQKQSMLLSSIPSTSYAVNDYRLVVQPTNRDKFDDINSNGIKLVSQEPVSTFSVDVDTGSYAVVRKYLNNGQLPPSNAVRVEELVNYFDYQYQQPKTNDIPFSVNTQVAQTPWNKNTQLVQIGLQGFVPNTPRNAANLVFLIDVSGSMSAMDKLPLLKNAFKLLVKQMTKNDRVSLVLYAGSSGIALKPTAGDQRGTILNAINELRSGGSTNGASGIRLAYQLAEQAFIKGGTNRVILATDGDFNVGTVNHDALIDLIKQKKKSGIALTTLGFGQGNYNDALMEQLADYGDGNYAYIDNLSEARKVLVEQISATLDTIAKDVKIQIEWNPNQVAEYRLIGYENRLLKREDFNNDMVDAGDIGAGHSVTALYEISLTNSQSSMIDSLRYQSQAKTLAKPSTMSHELAFVKLRYKNPKQDNSATSQLLQQAILKPSEKDNKSLNHELGFAASVAAFAQKLRGGKQLNDFDYDDILNLARHFKGADQHGYRGEFLKLVALAQSLDS